MGGFLVYLGVPVEKAALFAPHIDYVLGRFSLTTKEERCAFLAQTCIESTYYTKLEEGLYYTTPSRVLSVFPSKVKSLQHAETLCRNPRKLANTVYANRNGNGDEASDDGWRYRGQGVIQLTGKSNYALAAQRLGIDYVSYPEWLQNPSDAVLTAGDYWARNRCSYLLASKGMDAVTEAINGKAKLHAKERRDLYAKALRYEQ